MKMYGGVQVEFHCILILALDMPQLLTPVPTGLAVRVASEQVGMLWTKDEPLSLPKTNFALSVRPVT